MRSARTLVPPLFVILVLLSSYVVVADSFSDGESASTVLGQGSFTSGAFLNTSPSSLGIPLGVAFDSSGDLWVSQYLASRILEFVPGTGGCAAHEFCNNMSASLVIGQPNFVDYASAFPNASRVSRPTGLAFDSSGDLWVSDNDNNRVLEFVPGTSGCPVGELCSDMSASVVIGQSNFTSSAESTTARGLSSPEYIAFDSSGDLWVADANNNRVLEYVPGSSGCPAFHLCTGMAASLVIGQSSFDDGNFTGPGPNVLALPYAVAFDHSGNLWVTDTFNNRILEYLKGTGFTDGESAALVLGQTNFNDWLGGDTSTGLVGPWDLVFDSFGNLWVSDLNNNRVLEYSAPLTTDGQAASTVIGQPGFTTDGNATTANGFDVPEGVAMDPSGDLWVADASNNRVLEFGGQQTGTTTTSAQTTTSSTGSTISVVSTPVQTVTTTVSKAVPTTLTTTSLVNNTVSATVTSTTTSTKKATTLTATQTQTQTQTTVQQTIYTWAYGLMAGLLVIGLVLGYAIGLSRGKRSTRIATS